MVYPAAKLRHLQKSTAGDPKCYPGRYEKPRLDIEAVVLRKGVSVDLKALNACKPVKWRFVVRGKEHKRSLWNSAR